MPSRLLPSLPASPPLNNNHRYHHHRLRHHLLPSILAGALSFTIFCLVVLVFFFYRKLSRKRTAPSDLKSPTHNHNSSSSSNQQQQCRRFSYSLLRSATASFSTSNRLGHGGFGSVYKAIIPSTNQPLAVKLMDPNGSLQGEREFHNELSLASSLDSPHIVSLLGFSSDRRRKKLILVYELMENRSLQDALLDRKCEELMNWRKRFDIVSDVAKGIEYLHHFCNPPVTHGDIKPSNILLDADFNAKIGDFGLARLKTEETVEKKEASFVVVAEDNGSILEETESVVTAYEDSSTVAGIDRSPESFAVRVLDSDASPEMATAAVVSPEMGMDKGSISEMGFDKVSVDSGKDLVNGGKKGGSRRDWWWKQDNGGGSESGRVKDYVMEWIGSEIKKERPKNEWIASPSSVDNSNVLRTKSLSIEPRKKHKKRLDWWASLDEERMQKKDKYRKPREWWKEEFCEELTKKKKKRGLNSSNGGDSWWQKDDNLVQETKKKNKRSRGSIDWWLDGFSGELRNGRRNSQDWLSGEIPKSGGVSSTPSMRGTVCYIAPEYGGGGLLSEKCDVYSFGVLLLVVVSGRRPLQVTASPMSEFERANLISWARQLAYNGKLLDLVDPSIHSLDKDQALLCITIALLCLQRSPTKRPTMKEIVGMLSGETEPPHLPFEFSPSPPSNFPFKSRKKAR
ncbi:ATP binding protein, putative [Ricinus communis]|uniref:non-specific serine/threonine protein kinase n=1 Tax=Ricinus communis TaxID=3988 RepID=B9RDG2_RICCO|nr:ATP binding protein, putative [Ricinus communis]|eukprot:XP_002511751.1 receptor-like serine/threonine-protein kinase At2g45590 [Ricinus communis]